MAVRSETQRRSPRARDPDTREALLRAAAELVAERGFPDTSVDEIAARAGYSKGAVYWHFDSKDDLFLALVEERVDGPTREMIALLESAPPEHDMAPEGSRRLGELLSGQRELVLLDHEYWLQAVRDPKLRRRYARRRRELLGALGRALAARMEHLGGPPVENPEELAAVVIALGSGLAQQKLIDPSSVREALFGETIVRIFRGIVASADAQTVASTHVPSAGDAVD